MGSLFSRSRRSQQYQQQQPSASDQKQQQQPVRPPLATEVWKISGLKEQTIVRLPGSLDGHRLVIEDCTVRETASTLFQYLSSLCACVFQDCTIYVADRSAIVTVDECVRCRVVLGPVEGSCFVRTCRGCTFAVACQQWRTRECEDCDLLLFVSTDPIIESSHDMRFGCFDGVAYAELAAQLATAHLDVFNNVWSAVYDFTPAAGNWSFLVGTPKLPLGTPPEELLSATTSSASLPAIPLTKGRQGAESVAVAFVGDGAVEAALAVCIALRTEIARTAHRSKLPRGECAKLMPGFDMPPGKELDVIGIDLCSQQAAASLPPSPPSCSVWTASSPAQTSAFGNVFFQSQAK